jgi:hypothetical protein
MILIECGRKNTLYVAQAFMPGTQNGASASFPDAGLAAGGGQTSVGIGLV